MSCDDSQSDNKLLPTEINSIHFGIYIDEDDDCSDNDIQYATLDNEGITIFDYLGDDCDDTVACYNTHTYELSEITQDSFLIISEAGSVIVDGMINIDEDSTMMFSYSTNAGSDEYMWVKISEDVLSFTHTCDQEYGSTKDIADIMVYAVSDDGNLL